MTNGFKAQHWNDENGNPAGGSTFGAGFAISWQNGPIGRCTCPKPTTDYPDMLLAGHAADCERLEPNGAFVEDIIAAAADRILHYQTGDFFCEENAVAVVKLSEALAALHSRTEGRIARRVEGTHEA